MIRIGICDDLVEQLQIQEEMVRNIVCRFGLNTEIKCFQSGEDLLWEMEQKGNMDIILLDIEMGGINGVETARRIREKDNRAILFFISYYEQYCKEIINVQPFRFIDKPVSEEELDRGFREAFNLMIGRWYNTSCFVTDGDCDKSQFIVSYFYLVFIGGDL